MIAAMTGGGQRGFDLALGLRRGRLVGQPGLGAWRWDRRRWLRCRVDKGHRLRQRGRRRDGRDRRIAHGRALAAYRVGPKCRQPQENQYRPAPHRLHSTGSRKDAQAVSRAGYRATARVTLIRSSPPPAHAFTQGPPDHFPARPVNAPAAKWRVSACFKRKARSGMGSG
jgi:hypothetical protein